MQDVDQVEIFLSRLFTKSGICLMLGVVILAVYGQVYAFDYAYYDDAHYVFDNPNVTTGLSPENVIWAFSAGYAANWHPVTWMSHMLDVSMFGIRPGGHHVVSLLFHLVNSVLLFLVFRRSTGSDFIGAAISFLFAVHPLRAESVAWIAERKDVLFMFWGMISLLFYLKFVESRRVLHYLLVMIFFGLSLMSKPMLVTFPVVLLLFDFWPLNRLPLDSGDFWKIAKQRIFEKVPLFAMTIGSGVMTVIAQSRGGAVKSLTELPFDVRVANSVVAYVKYIGMMFWPSGLAFDYAHELRNMSDPLFLLCLVVLIACTVLFWGMRVRHPYFLMGWVWYIVTTIPVIGLLQVGYQGMADRYTYFTQIGLGIIVVYLCNVLLEAKVISRRGLMASWFSLSILLMVLTFNQVQTWRSLFTLTDHALKVTTHNPKAHYGKGIAFVFRGEDEEAVKEFQEALRIAPHYQEVRIQLELAEERLRQRRRNPSRR